MAFPSLTDVLVTAFNSMLLALCASEESKLPRLPLQLLDERGSSPTKYRLCCRSPCRKACLSPMNTQGPLETTVLNQTPHLNAPGWLVQTLASVPGVSRELWLPVPSQPPFHAMHLPCTLRGSPSPVTACAHKPNNSFGSKSVF